MFLRVLGVETENSLENFGRIQLIIAKFSREFYREGCQSCQSLNRLSIDCKPFVDKGFVSLSVFNTFFTTFVT